MSKSPEDCYDHLVDHYALSFPDWQESARRQGQFIARVRGAPSRRVYATDMSARAIEQARKTAGDLEPGLTFDIADLRMLDRQVPGQVDVVSSFDNSLSGL